MGGSLFSSQQEKFRPFLAGSYEEQQNTKTNKKLFTFIGRLFGNVVRQRALGLFYSNY